MDYYADIFKNDDGTVMQQWIVDLESGEYEQTYGWLQCVPSSEGSQHQIGFCCLGVLCHRLGVPREVDTQEGIVWYDGESSMPPLPITTWLKDKYGIAAGQLAAMNDGSEWDDERYNPHTFEEIAEYLRHTVDNLTVSNE